MIDQMQRRWIFPSSGNEAAAERLARDLGIPGYIAGILIRNGLFETGAAERFLQPRLKEISDPFALPGMEAAAQRIWQAIDRQEKIVLYGDYDVDGVAALTLLHRVFGQLGARSECFLPHRIEEGYGLSEAGIGRCFEEHRPELLVAVDCGTNSAREIGEANRRGAEVIVLDHHEPLGARPECAAMVNPKLNGKLTYLCSAGLAFKLAHALLKIRPRPNIDLKDYLDIVALGTIADIVPLIEENRILVRRGLRQMETTKWPGLRALMNVADVTRPSSSDIGFRLGPRINAAGRLGTAQAALHLLLCDDALEAEELARQLDQQNRERQGVERQVIDEVEKWLLANFEPERDACIVAGERDWHHGVLGIVAARIMRRHHRPTLLVGFDDSGVGKGSGRSIEGLSIVRALDQCATHLEKFGGHDMAAGVTVQQERFEAFQEAFRSCARSLVNEDILTPKLRLDAELRLDDIDRRLLDIQSLLEPHGAANPQPIFAVRGVQPSREPRVLKEKHLRFEFEARHRRVEAIFFQGAEEALPPPPWDVAFAVERNDFQGRTSAQMRVIALRSAA